jgi:hypothetical protein
LKVIEQFFLFNDHLHSYLSLFLMEESEWDSNFQRLDR